MADQTVVRVESNVGGDLAVRAVALALADLPVYVVKEHRCG